MSRIHLAIPGAILCAATLVQAAVAAPPAADQSEGRVSMASYRHRSSGIQTVAHEIQPAGGEVPAPGPGPAPALNPNGINVGQYPQLNAPLYPSPVQTVPTWTGGTVITNQAFAPHELLYPHDYHAMYGPFYYQVKGCWLWTPLGMRQHERWTLQGTEVKVKYRTSHKLFSGFHPPVSH